MRLRLAPGTWLLLLLACAGASAQGYKPVVETRSRDALRGVEVVRVFVETTPFAEQRGVTAARLEAGAVERLRKAGLRVLTGEEAKRATGAQIFFIRVLLFDTTTNYSFTTDVQMRETIRLTRPPATEMMAATWQNAAHGLLTTRDTERVLEGMLSVVDFFVREHKAANDR
jgi:hypothetical protein